MRTFRPLTLLRSKVRLQVLSLSTLLLVACSCGGENPGEATGYMVKGVVKDAAGNPLPDVRVDAHNSLLSNSYVSGLTDAEGHYSIKLSRDLATTYYVVANMDVRWDDQDWKLALHPDNPNPFDAEAGAVINFTWKLSGERPGGTFYGNEVLVYPELERDDLDFENVEVEFVPNGPLIDGSEGEAFTLDLGEATYLDDVPLGRYTATARYATDPSVRLVLRRYENPEDPWAGSLETGFLSHGTFGTLRLTVSDVE